MRANVTISTKVFDDLSLRHVHTEIHLYVDPSELRLARVAHLVWARLGHFGQLHTGPLPAPHVPDGDRVEHYYSELSL